MARSTIYSFFILSSLLIHAPAFAQTFFRTWFDAPETVVAGDTFTVDVWAETSGEWVGEGDFSSYFHGFLMSAEVLGNLETFSSISEASIYFSYPLSPGTPEGPRLNDVMAFNLFGFGFNGTMDNPARLFSFDVSTVSGTTGELILLHQPSSVSPDLLRWYIDPFVGDDWYLGSADDNSVLTTESFTVRVIPTPAAAALLAFAGLGTLRRQR